MNNTLIIFVKNAREGEVKTRLSETIGTKRALLVYEKLLRLIHDTTLNLPYRKSVFYSDQIEQNDIWENDRFEKHLQQGADLGERMYVAMESSRKKGGSVCLVGADIPDLSEYIIDKAFELLAIYDVVIGPAEDGGYYLIAMNKPIKEIFEDKPWGTGLVLKETIDALEKSKLAYGLLPVLNDIDTIEDIRKGGHEYLLRS
jgi:hypothetical protein